MKNKYLIIAIIFYMVSSLFSTLDTKAEKYIDASLVKASVAYGTARGVNAIVSVFQSAEMSVSIGIGGSFQIGEILDPLNDLIERFSDVMFTVIGSLMLQEILLMIVTKPVFKIGLIAFGLFCCLMIFLKNKPYARFSFKVFLIFVVIRFSLSFVLFANSFVADLFLTERIDKSSSSFENKASDFSELSQNAQNNPEYNQYISKINENTKKIEENQSELNELKQKIKKMQSSNDIDSYVSQIDKLKVKGLHYVNIIEDLKDENEEIHDELEGDLSYLEKFIKIKNSLRFSVIKQKIDNLINYIFELIMLFILQVILIPIAFLFALRSVVRSVWNYELEFDTIENESKDNLIETNIVNNKQLNQ